MKCVKSLLEPILIQIHCMRFKNLNQVPIKQIYGGICVLYIHGGIYLDIKFECVNKFPLIKLTDKEYWVRDTNIQNIIGIYQALMVWLSKNPNSKKNH